MTYLQWNSYFFVCAKHFRTHPIWRRWHVFGSCYWYGTHLYRVVHLWIQFNFQFNKIRLNVAAFFLQSNVFKLRNAKYIWKELSAKRIITHQTQDKHVPVFVVGLIKLDFMVSANMIRCNAWYDHIIIFTYERRIRNTNSPISRSS